MCTAQVVAFDMSGLVWCKPGRLAGCEVVAGLSAAARNVVVPGEMRCDDLCTSAGVGTLGQRVERAYGDWRSAAVVGIVAWPVLGQ